MFIILTHQDIHIRDLRYLYQEGAIFKIWGSKRQRWQIKRQEETPCLLNSIVYNLLFYHFTCSEGVMIIDSNHINTLF